jgi:hypothetical protein
MLEGKQIVLEATEGIVFRMREEENGLVRITALKAKEKIASSGDYQNPPIPEGFRYLTGSWKDGFTIKKESDGSEFVWIPVGWLQPNGTLDGRNFIERFGRRKWRNEEFTDEEFHEEVNQSLLDSVQKYGGLYIARYHASNENGEVVFKQNRMPLVNVDFYEAKQLAEAYARNEEQVNSSLTTGSTFDSLLQWIIQSGAKTKEEVVEDSTSWGNYFNTTNSPQKVLPTGSNENWCVCNIFDIAGNTDEWTEEQNSCSRRVLRGGSCSSVGYSWPAAPRGDIRPSSSCSDTSFRVLLYVK